MSEVPTGIEQHLLAPAGDLQATQAKVVRSTFHQHRRELLRQNRLQERQILVDELLLQRDGVRADHHPLVVADDPLDRGQQIRKAFAHAGAGFDQQVGRPVERLGHTAGHGQLLRARLIVRQAPRDQPPGAEQLRRVHAHHLPAVFVPQSKGRFKCAPRVSFAIANVQATDSFRRRDGADR